MRGVTVEFPMLRETSSTSDKYVFNYIAINLDSYFVFKGMADTLAFQTIAVGVTILMITRSH